MKSKYGKALIIISSLAMLLSFAACGKSTASNPETTAEPVATVTETAAEPTATVSETASDEESVVIVGTVPVRDTQMRYAKFGNGEKTLVILPGLSLTYTTDSAEKTASHFSEYTKNYTVYTLDVIDDVPDDYTIAQMSQDDVDVLKELGVTSMDIYANSMGGMQGIWIAGEYPDMVNHLAVCSTSCVGNELSHSITQNWIEFAMDGDGVNLVKDMVEHIYSPSYIEAKGDKLTAGSDSIPTEVLTRFANIVRAADSADVTEQAKKITCPTMVFGSLGDKLFTVQPSVELADIIGCDCYLYNNSYGHAVFSEATADYKDRVFSFYSLTEE